MINSKSFLCANYNGAEWHTHFVQMTDEEIMKTYPVADRLPIAGLSVGHALIRNLGSRVITRIK